MSKRDPHGFVVGVTKLLEGGTAPSTNSSTSKNALPTKSMLTDGTAMRRVDASAASRRFPEARKGLPLSLQMRRELSRDAERDKLKAEKTRRRGRGP